MYGLKTIIIEELIKIRKLKSIQKYNKKVSK